MKLTAFGDSPAGLEKLTRALEGEGMEATVAPSGSPETSADDPPARTASALIASERLLVERRPAAVVLAGTGDRVLAAGLAASKLEIPVIRLRPKTTTGGGDHDRNDRLLALLADLTVEPDADAAALAIGAWLRETASARPGAGPAGV